MLRGVCHGEPSAIAKLEKGLAPYLYIRVYRARAENDLLLFNYCPSSSGPCGNPEPYDDPAAEMGTYYIEARTLPSEPGLPGGAWTKYVEDLDAALDFSKKFDLRMRLPDFCLALQVLIARSAEQEEEKARGDAEAR